MNQLDSLIYDEPTELPRERNIQPPAVIFKPCTSPPKTSPVVSDVWGDVIIITFIVMMFKFTLQSIHLNLSLTLF